MQDLNNPTNQSQTQMDNIPWGISKLTKDMNFVGMFTIIYGVINCLTIIGAIIGIPLIFMGLRLRESATNFDIYKNGGDKIAFQNSVEKLYKYFNIQKILIIITLVFFVLYIIGIVLFLSWFSSDNFGNEIFSLLKY
ncbi:MAG: DUF5362 domain-containing protein [Ignavibacteriae bacterium]|nr:DUF5362 domain-containing protein [Ignavibacteriota bacterium]